jgi:hypothetical protein
VNDIWPSDVVEFSVSCTLVLTSITSHCHSRPQNNDISHSESRSVPELSLYLLSVFVNGKLRIIPNNRHMTLAFVGN